MGEHRSTDVEARAKRWRRWKDAALLAMTPRFFQRKFRPGCEVCGATVRYGRAEVGHTLKRFCSRRCRSGRHNRKRMAA
jgi:hypothetical protein